MINPKLALFTIPLNLKLPLHIAELPNEEEDDSKSICPSDFDFPPIETPDYVKQLRVLTVLDEKEQEELFQILESNNSSNSLEDDFSSSSDSCYHSADDSSGSPNVKIGCRDSYCNVIKSINVLTKSEENESLLIKLISQIENPELQKEYLDKLKKNLMKDKTAKKLKSTISFEENLERFNKKKSKDLIVSNLQHEILLLNKK